MESPLEKRYRMCINTIYLLFIRLDLSVIGIFNFEGRGFVVSVRKIGVIVGLLFLSSTVAFSVGASLIQEFVDGNSNQTSLTIGVLLQIYCGIAIAGIGILMYPILKPYNKRLALGYVSSRVLEFAVITISGIYLLSQLKVVPSYDLLIYVFTGAGGLILSYLLYVSKLIPRLLSVIGIIGYLLLLIGVLAGVFGNLDLNTGLGLLFLIPGGLFEILLPIWLFIKGFKMTASAVTV